MGPIPAQYRYAGRCRLRLRARRGRQRCRGVLRAIPELLCPLHLSFRVIAPWGRADSREPAPGYTCSGIALRARFTRAAKAVISIRLQPLRSLFVHCSKRHFTFRSNHPLEPIPPTRAQSHISSGDSRAPAHPRILRRTSTQEAPLSTRIVTNDVPRGTIWPGTCLLAQILATLAATLADKTYLFDYN